MKDLEVGTTLKIHLLQTVRRDNCRLVSSVIETCLHKMLIDRNVDEAQA